MRLVQGAVLLGALLVTLGLLSLARSCRQNCTTRLAMSCHRLSERFVLRNDSGWHAASEYLDRIMGLHRAMFCHTISLIRHMAPRMMLIFICVYSVEECKNRRGEEQSREASTGRALRVLQYTVRNTYATDI